MENPGVIYLALPMQYDHVERRLLQVWLDLVSQPPVSCPPATLVTHAVIIWNSRGWRHLMEQLVCERNLSDLPRLTVPELAAHIETELSLSSYLCLQLRNVCVSSDNSTRHTLFARLAGTLSSYLQSPHLQNGIRFHNVIRCLWLFHHQRYTS